MRKRAPVTFETVRDIALALPGVEEGTSYGTPSLRVRGKFMARLREDGETLVVKVSEAEREFRMTVDPETFFITEHYRGYPAVLVRLARVDPEDLGDLIEQSWRWLAPRRLVAEYERTHPATQSSLRGAKRRNRNRGGATSAPGSERRPLPALRWVKSRVTAESQGR